MPAAVRYETIPGEALGRCLLATTGCAAVGVASADGSGALRTFPTDEGDLVLAVENLEVVYEDVILVLKGVSLTVPQGEIVALLGANGAGKTTVLRAITGLLGVHRGEIRKGMITLDGEPLHNLDAPRTVAAGVSQVMEARRIFTELTVEENLRIGAHTAARAT